LDKLHLALFGNPVAHSLSPRIHQAFSDQFNLQLKYELICSSPEQFSGQLENLRQSGARGCNITVPLKTRAHDRADHLSTAARTAGAVNTFTFQADGIYADNTDGIGWLNDLTQAGSSIHNKSVCILGAGGAAAGISPVIIAQSPASLIIANRSREKAEQLLAQYADTRFRSVTPTELLEAGEHKFDLLINATSIGHQGKHPNLIPELFNPGALLYDLNYGPAAEPLKNWCEQNSINYRDGLGMLVEQAALAFKLWTGNKPETQTVLASLSEKLKPHA